jgi:polyphosphate kinase 2 (PPK2 family)
MIRFTLGNSKNLSPLVFRGSQHKITDEDWRNREKWPAYAEAVNEMVFRTGTEVAPWTLVSAEDKYMARIQVLTTVVERLSATLALGAGKKKS